MTSDLHHLAAAYALDALDDDERRAFDLHYPTCEICTNEVREFRKVAEALAESTETAPPAELRGRVLAEITETRQDTPLVGATGSQGSAPSARSGFNRSMILAAAAALLLLGGFVAVTSWPSDSTAVNEVVDSVDAVVTMLDPTTESQQGQLQVVWSDDRDQVAVVGSRLDDLDPDKAYALWFLLDDGVAPAGLFRPEDGSISAVLDIEDLDHNGWGITIEPAEGSDQPTTDVIFAGTI